MAGVMVISASAANAEGVMIIGAGNVSCGAWTASRKNIDAFQQEQWVMGFLSGMAYAKGETGVDPLHGMDWAGVTAWVSNYCLANPIKDVFDAAVAFRTAHQH